VEDAREGKRKAAVPTPRRARERRERGRGSGVEVDIVVVCWLDARNLRYFRGFKDG
jgi:hypothetical protein